MTSEKAQTFEEKELFKRLCATAHKLADLKVPILVRDNKHVDWLETQITQIEKMGIENFIQHQS